MATRYALTPAGRALLGRLSAVIAANVGRGAYWTAADGWIDASTGADDSQCRCGRCFACYAEREGV